MKLLPSLLILLYACGCERREIKAVPDCVHAYGKWTNDWADPKVLTEGLGYKVALRQRRYCTNCNTVDFQTIGVK